MIIDKRQMTREGIPRFYPNECPTLNATMWKDPYLVLVTPKSTSTQRKFIKNTSQTIKTMETSQPSTQTLYPTSTSSLEASLVRLFQSLASEVALKIPEGRSSLTLREYCEQNDLDYSSLKTLKDFSAMTTATLSEPSSPRLMSWGMTSNGKCLTAKITESHRTGSASSLSDILEEHPDPKYSLSTEAAQKLLAHQKENWSTVEAQ